MKFITNCTSILTKIVKPSIHKFIPCRRFHLCFQWSTFFWKYFAATLQVGNILPVHSMPEGTIVCMLEHKTGDRGRLSRASGCYATVISHNPDTKRSRVRLPSGAKKVIPSANRGMVGMYHEFVITHYDKLFLNNSSINVELCLSNTTISGL